MTFMPGGTFVMGSERHQPEEHFRHTVGAEGFWIDRHEVQTPSFKSLSRRWAM